MNRFFSKLDLRDIKIDPTGTRFPPDAEEFKDEQGEASAQATDGAAETLSDFGEPARQPHVPAWASEQPATNSHVEEESFYPAHGATDVAELPPADASADTASEDEVRSGEVLKVSARSRPSAVAGAIAGVVRESGRAEVQAIGAGATNQAVKAVAIARDYLRETGIEAICLPAFIDVIIDNEDRTAIRLVVEPR
jgi:stage V sporulation protein S